MKLHWTFTQRKREPPCRQTPSYRSHVHKMIHKKGVQDSCRMIAFPRSGKPQNPFTNGWYRWQMKLLTTKVLDVHWTVYRFYKSQLPLNTTIRVSSIKPVPEVFYDEFAAVASKTADSHSPQTVWVVSVHNMQFLCQSSNLLIPKPLCQILGQLLKS